MNFTLTRPNLIKLLLPLFAFAATFLAVKLIDSPSGSGSAGAGAGASAAGFSDARTTDAAHPLPAGRRQERHLTRGSLRRARRRVPAEGPRDRRPRPVRTRGVRIARGARPRSARRRRAHGDGLARERAPRLPRRAALRRARPRGGAGRREALRRDRGRAGRAGPLRRRRAHAAAHGRPEAQPLLIRARVLLPRAARGPARARSRRCGWRPPPAATRARTSPTCETLLGNLELARGRSADAERAFRLALSRYPGYVPAQAGLARTDRESRGLASAARRYRALVDGAAGARRPRRRWPRSSSSRAVARRPASDIALVDACSTAPSCARAGRSTPGWW